MVRDERPARIPGLWCRIDKTFYYLESGPVTVRNSLDRLRKILITRGLIEFNRQGTKVHEEPYLVMNMQQAKDKHYEVRPVYLNKHVQTMAEATKDDGSSNPWK